MDEEFVFGLILGGLIGIVIAGGGAAAIFGFSTADTECHQYECVEASRVASYKLGKVSQSGLVNGKLTIPITNTDTQGSWFQAVYSCWTLKDEPVELSSSKIYLGPGMTNNAEIKYKKSIGEDWKCQFIGMRSDSFNGCELREKGG